MKVVVLGNTGMLGHMVQDYLRKDARFEVVGLGRDVIDVRPGATFLEARLARHIDRNTDYVINCIGAIKPVFKAGNEPECIYTNAVFPWILSRLCGMLGAKLIHVTSDCAYSGSSMFYTELCPADATDIYGQSKALGEPTDCMNLRTSIIGPEIRGRKSSFFEWVLSQGGKDINGFNNHLWNGLTTLELARCIRDIMVDNLWVVGTRHIFSEDISKYSMVSKILKLFTVDASLKEVVAPHPIDRRLRTIHPLNTTLAPKGFNEMLVDLKGWMGK
jgi:dTDP-4-dehydrorhamnose reductase